MFVIAAIEEVLTTGREAQHPNAAGDCGVDCRTARAEEISNESEKRLPEMNNTYSIGDCESYPLLLLIEGHQTRNGLLCRHPSGRLPDVTPPSYKLASLCPLRKSLSVQRVPNHVSTNLVKERSKTEKICTDSFDIQREAECMSDSVGVFLISSVRSAPAASQIVSAPSTKGCSLPLSLCFSLVTVTADSSCASALR